MNTDRPSPKVPLKFTAICSLGLLFSNLDQLKCWPKEKGGRGRRWEISLRDSGSIAALGTTAYTTHLPDVILLYKILWSATNLNKQCQARVNSTWGLSASERHKIWTVADPVSDLPAPSALAILAHADHGPRQTQLVSAKGLFPSIIRQSLLCVCFIAFLLSTLTDKRE